MNRALPASLVAVALAGCMTPTSSKPHSVAHAGIWTRNTGINPDAAKVQQITAMQAKQARCGTQVTQRQGTDGTSPRDYKCKKGQS